MPLVMVHCDPRVVSDDSLGLLNSYLSKLVAEVLDASPEGPLTANDVEVITYNYQEFDVHHNSFDIIVIANDYPSRRMDLEQRKNLLMDRLKIFLKSVRYLNGKKFSVWIVLAPSAFGEA